MALTILTDAWAKNIWRRLFPKPEALTFLARTAPGSAFTSYALTHVQKRPGGKKDDIDPALAHQVASFLLSADDLASVSAPVPKVKDVILQADGARWTILSVDSHLLNNMHFCECVRERVNQTT